MTEADFDLLGIGNALRYAATTGTVAYFIRCVAYW